MSDGEVTNTTEAAATTEAAPKIKRGPARVVLITPEGDELKALKYPMPLKAPRFNLTVNDKVCEAAQTTFGSILYTYFMYEGASFYVPGHLPQDVTYKFEYPEGYKFVPLKLDRAAQSAAAAKNKKAKAPAAEADASQKADAGAVQADAASETAGEGVGSSPGSEALHEAAEEPQKKRKAQR